jgi:hypothetical protein
VLFAYNSIVRPGRAVLFLLLLAFPAADVGAGALRVSKGMPVTRVHVYWVNPSGQEVQITATLPSSWSARSTT